MAGRIAADLESVFGYDAADRLQPQANDRQFETGGSSAAPMCSNQADLHLTFIDLIWPSDLPQRPSLTSMPLATDQMLLSAEFGHS